MQTTDWVSSMSVFFRLYTTLVDSEPPPPPPPPQKKKKNRQSGICPFSISPLPWKQLTGFQVSRISQKFRDFADHLSLQSAGLIFFSVFAILYLERSAIQNLISG